jgi:phosphatidate cytidylyltransferase
LKNITQRAISGIIYLAIIIGSLMMGKFAFGMVFLLITLIALYEFYGLTLASGASPFVVPALLSSAAIFVLSFLVASEMANPAILVLILPLIIFMLMVVLYSRKPDVIANTAISFLGILYVTVPLSTMNFLAFPESTASVYTYRIVLGILTLVWINDTGAYLVGITIGRHRLFERISPKKSIEGAIGGAVLTVLGAWWLNRIMCMLSRTDWVVLALIVSVFGVFGDLTESLIKRSVGQKDSGTIIPGHGGVLDRIDSVLFVMPLSLVYLLLSNL